MSKPPVHVGDEFLVRFRGLGGDRICHVTKVTKRQFECGGWRWHADTWRAIGGNSWTRPWLEPATDEHRKAFKEAAMRRAVARYGWNEASPGIIAAVHAILFEETPK